MHDVISFTLLAFSAIFFVVDPFAVVPVFVSMTEGDDEAKRARMALKACLLCAGVLTSFALGGGVIFKVLGITLAAFKMAGGVLLMLTALDMLRSQTAATRTSPGEIAEAVEKADVAIVPLGMPLLAGPGSIATVMVLAGRSTHWWELIPIVVSIVVTAAIAYMILRAATRVDRFLGRSGRAILERTMGLLLAAVAVQFVVDGVREALPELFAR
jgi:multiple antibiotic resistance protein